MLRACPAFPRGWHRAARQRADKIDGSQIQNPAYGPLNKTPDAKASGVLFFKAVKAFFSSRPRPYSRVGRIYI